MPSPYRSSSGQKPRRLLLDGGGDLPPAAMSFFKVWMRGQRHSEFPLTLLLLPWASEREGHEHIADADVWIAPASDCITAVLAPSIAQINADPAILEATLSSLHTAHGIFCCGGDQERFMSLLDAHPSLLAALSASFHAGCPVAGTSAGTAIMSHTMITGQDLRNGSPTPPSAPFSAPNPDLTPDPEPWPWGFIEIGRVATRRGLGFARGLVCDQHFIRRQRFNRLLSVLRDPATQERAGLGVDEDAAVCIEWSRGDGSEPNPNPNRGDGSEPASPATPTPADAAASVFIGAAGAAGAGGEVACLRVFASKPSLVAVLVALEGPEGRDCMRLEVMPANTGRVWTLRL